MNKLDNSTGATNPGSYMVDAYVHQLGRGASRFSTNNNSNPTSNSLRTYKFYSIFPTNVSQIDLSYDTSDTIEEYTVEFQVQWWQAMGDDQTGIEIS